MQNLPSKQIGETGNRLFAKTYHRQQTTSRMIRGRELDYTTDDGGWCGAVVVSALFLFFLLN